MRLRNPVQDAKYGQLKRPVQQCAWSGSKAVNDPPDKPSVFISYCRKDEVWRKHLEPHLRTLVQQGHVVLWDDQKIGTGDDWYPAILDAMGHAAVAVCLISPDFLASDFIIKEEIPFLLERRQEEGMLLLPIYARACPWKAVSWLKKFQMFPAPETPLAYLTKAKRDQALADIAHYIYEKIKDKSFTVVKPATVWAALADEYVSIERLPRTGSEVFGRAEELGLLDEAWESETARIISFVAWGGVGKSALVNKWVEQIKEDNYRRARRVYAWSFYSQGTGERVASADMFIDQALRWFGDSAFADTNRSGWDKGQRVAELVQQERTLLLLDGLEPLQSDYEHDRGQVKDPALRVLIEELAKNNPGLCVITTREALPGFDGDSESFVQQNLEQISAEAGRSLLRIAGIRGTDEQLEQATRDFGNHALAINLLAAYLQDMPGRDIAHARLIPDLDIPEQEGRHPRRVMEVFAKKFEGQPELNVLNMMGLFDRPATAREITALRTQTEIPELTDRIRWLTDDEWERTIHDLRTVRLLAPQSHHNPGVLDAHPLVREHFGQRLQEDKEESWKQGHSHLYEFLSKLAPPLPGTLEEMAPLYLAVGHGCQAGRHAEAFEEVYELRIRRGSTDFNVDDLGALGADLAVLRNFFETPWDKPVKKDHFDHGRVLTLTGLRLRGLGLLREARRCLREGLAEHVKVRNWAWAAKTGRHLSRLHLIQGYLSRRELIQGQLASARWRAEEALKYAERSSRKYDLMAAQCAVSAAHHQLGDLASSAAKYREAERVQKHRERQRPRLYKLHGYRYCDLLLDLGAHREAQERAAEALEWTDDWALAIALHHLTLGRAALVAALHGDGVGLPEVARHLDRAVDGLRGAGHQDESPPGFLGRAEYYRERTRREGGGEFFEQARCDVDEAMTIAKRGEMRLHECDCHLEYARLHLAQGEKDEARQRFVTARKMVDEMGYHRRDAEVLLLKARLELLEGNRERARQTLAAAKQRIDEMGCHRWDIDAAEIETEL